jgi:hypothetical protein
VAALMGLISGNAEVLPLLSDEGAELFVLNVTCVIDALDQERSEVLRFPGGRIMLIKQPVFKQDLLNGVELFRLPHRASSTYVGSNFVTAVRAAGLEGLEFREAKTS